MKQVLLRYVDKLYCMLLVVVIVGCNRELSSEQLRQMREKSYQVSLDAVGSDDYWSIYNAMNDTIKVWADNNLGLYKYYKDSIIPRTAYQIDSIICFNLSKDMCFTGVLLQTHHPDAVMDNIQHFYGTNINNQWYFFPGATMVLIRERYQKEIHVPLSFEKLKELAMKHLYQTYLRKSKDGEWVISDAFFDRYYKYGASSNKIATKAERDSSWLNACRENWSRRN